MQNDFEIIETRDATVVNDVERQVEESLRPTHLGEYIGQSKLKDTLRVYMKGALQRREALDHVLLAGPPGLGKLLYPQLLPMKWVRSLNQLLHRLLKRLAI